MANLGDDFAAEPDLGKDFEGEPGHPGPSPYKEGPDKPQPQKLTDVPLGGPADTAKNWVNTLTFGAAPYVEGAMGGLADALVKPITEHRPQTNEELLAAYRSVRDEGLKEHAQSAETGMGALGGALGVLTPHPLLPSPAPGMTIPQRAWQATKTGGVVGGINGAATSPAGLTSDEPGQWKRLLPDTVWGAAGGGATSAALGAGMGKAEQSARGLAEGQALRAAGLRGGIKNSVQKDLGISNMDDARQLGRRFLDEGLIPPVGSSEAVAARAEKLQGRAGNAIGATLAQADTSGKPFDYEAFSNAALKPYNNATSVAQRAGGKTLDLAEDLLARGQQTPGSFTGANEAKSDAWRSANFAADAPMASSLYRQAVGGARNNIEDQVRAALGPETAASLSRANERYGVAADAIKLAQNASTRDAAKKGLSVMDLLAIASAGTAGGAAGHTGTGTALGAAGVLGSKAFDKWGHASAARLSDALANRMSENTGGHLGGMAGSLAERYLRNNEEERPWAKLQGAK